MRLYEKIGFSGLALTAVLATGGTALSRYNEGISRYLHPESRQNLDNIARERTNLNIIDLSIQQVNDVVALCSCVKEYAPERGAILERELKAFNNDNIVARNKVQAKIAGYMQTPEIKAYEKAKENLGSLGGWVTTAAACSGLLSIGTLSLGDYGRRKRKSTTFVPIAS